MARTGNFFGIKATPDGLESWQTPSGELLPPEAWVKMKETAWGSSDWTNPSSPMCEAIKALWSTDPGIAALTNALEPGINTIQTPWENLPVEFKLALDHPSHWQRYEKMQKKGYYNRQLGDAALLSLVENFCEMLEGSWGIRLAKNGTESLYLVTELAKDKKYISIIGELCGIWELARKEKGWTGTELTDEHTRADVLEKALCHMVYEIVESRSSASSAKPLGLGFSSFQEQPNIDLLYTSIAFIVWYLLNKYPYLRYDKSYLASVLPYRSNSEK